MFDVFCFGSIARTQISITSRKLNLHFLMCIYFIKMSSFNQIRNHDKQISILGYIFNCNKVVFFLIEVFHKGSKATTKVSKTSENQNLDVLVRIQSIKMSTISLSRNRQKQTSILYDIIEYSKHVSLLIEMFYYVSMAATQVSKTSQNQSVGFLVCIQSMKMSSFIKSMNCLT